MQQIADWLEKLGMSEYAEKPRPWHDMRTVGQRRLEARSTKSNTMAIAFSLKADGCRPSIELGCIWSLSANSYFGQ
jgi:hypothetical protein